MAGSGGESGTGHVAASPCRCPGPSAAIRGPGCHGPLRVIRSIKAASRSSARSRRGADSRPADELLQRPLARGASLEMRRDGLVVPTAGLGVEEALQLVAGRARTHDRRPRRRDQSASIRIAFATGLSELADLFLEHPRHAVPCLVDGADAAYPGPRATSTAGRPSRAVRWYASQVSGATRSADGSARRAPAAPGRTPPPADGPGRRGPPRSPAAPAYRSCPCRRPAPRGERVLHGAADQRTQPAAEARAIGRNRTRAAAPTAWPARPG